MENENQKDKEEEKEVIPNPKNNLSSYNNSGLGNSFQGKISIASSVSMPIPDAELIGGEGKGKLRLSLIWILVDLFITLFLIVVECNLLFTKKKFNSKKLIINAVTVFFIYILLIIFILSHKTTLVIIAKYFYISVGSVYYIYKLALVIIYMVKNEAEISDFDLVIFCVTLASIIPRIFGFYNAELYDQILSRVDEAKRIEEHERLIEKIEKKIDKGYSRWTNDLEISRQQNNLTAFAESYNNNNNKEKK